MTSMRQLAVFDSVTREEQGCSGSAGDVLSVKCVRLTADPQVGIQAGERVPLEELRHCRLRGVGEAARHVHRLMVACGQHAAQCGNLAG